PRQDPSPSSRLRSSRGGPILGEQAVATLKGWRLLRKLRRGTHRITAIVQAVLVLHHASA
ncbi:hypothetical protein ADK34_10370, partial [Streptomyces viridochromogenes]